MATIYKFIVEQKNLQGGEGRKAGGGRKPKGAGKKGRWVSLLNSPKGGVEANRKMRAVNPLLNKMTFGYYEKATRLGRAGLGLVKRNTETGAFMLSGTSITIIISMIIVALMKWQNYEMQKAKKQNAQDFKQLETGIGAIHGQYKIVTNVLTGRQTYNQNK